MIPRPRAQVVHNISVERFYENCKDDLKLHPVTGENGFKALIHDNSLNRPALALTGYFNYFAAKRVQLFGAGEMGYLREQTEADQYRITKEILDYKPPLICISRNLAPPKPMLKAVEESSTSLMRSPLTSRDFTNTATIHLEQMFAPRLTEHGTMMDIKGIGTLLKGDSGVGKSECALALIERGYSLVADDTVKIRLMNERELMATGSELNRGYMECRGLGIINIAELFGIRAIRLEKRIDLIVNFIHWTEGVEEERTGLDQQYYTILGQEIPLIELPVRPGRDLARLVEVAAMVQALKKTGHDSAKEFNERLIQVMTASRT